jgi:pilus assembly protein Flp/PilA
MVWFQCSSRLLRDESGATAIEYGLIAALIAVAAIAAFKAVGSSLTTTFNGSRERHVNAPPCCGQHPHSAGP